MQVFYWDIISWYFLSKCSTHLRVRPLLLLVSSSDIPSAVHLNFQLVVSEIILQAELDLPTHFDVAIATLPCLTVVTYNALAAALKVKKRKRKRILSSLVKGWNITKITAILGSVINERSSEKKSFQQIPRITPIKTDCCHNSGEVRKLDVSHNTNPVQRARCMTVITL